MVSPWSSLALGESTDGAFTAVAIGAFQSLHAFRVTLERSMDFDRVSLSDFVESFDRCSQVWNVVTAEKNFDTSIRNHLKVNAVDYNN